MKNFGGSDMGAGITSDPRSGIAHSHHSHDHIERPDLDEEDDHDVQDLADDIHIENELN